MPRRGARRKSDPCSSEREQTKGLVFKFFLNLLPLSGFRGWDTSLPPSTNRGNTKPNPVSTFQGEFRTRKPVCYASTGKSAVPARACPPTLESLSICRPLVSGAANADATIGQRLRDHSPCTLLVDTSKCMGLACARGGWHIRRSFRSTTLRNPLSLR